MAIKIEMLRCFRAVVAQGSLAQAAEALGRTPSAVSMMLKQFEDHIGSPLFETARKSRLTPLGEMIHDEARRELDHFEAAIAKIESLARSETGFVRLATTPSVATGILPPIISRFAAASPKVQIDLRDMDSPGVLNAVLKERADIGIGTIPEMPGLERVQLFSDPFGVVCPRSHPLAQDWESLTWVDMVDVPFIENGLCGMIHDDGFAPILAGSRMMVPNTASLLGLVRAGVGVTILPKLAVPEGAADLAFLPLLDAKARRKVHLVTQPDQRLTPPARAFAAMIRQRFQID